MFSHERSECEMFTQGWNHILAHVLNNIFWYDVWKAWIFNTLACGKSSFPHGVSKIIFHHTSIENSTFDASVEGRKLCFLVSGRKWQINVNVNGAGEILLLVEKLARDLKRQILTNGSIFPVGCQHLLCVQAANFEITGKLKCHLCTCKVVQIPSVHVDVFSFSIWESY